MDIGMRLNENIKVNLSESREELINKLTKEEIRYNILYDKPDKQGLKETIISIGEFDTEIHLSDNKIIYISAYNNENTSVLNNDTENVSPIDFINLCKDRLYTMGIKNKELIEIDNLDFKTLNCSFNIKCNDNICRAITARDAHGNVFIKSIRILR